jgi:hypothetical protein
VFPGDCHNCNHPRGAGRLRAGLLADAHLNKGGDSHLSEIRLKDIPEESMLRIHNAAVYDLSESVAASKYAMQTKPDPSRTEITERTLNLATCKPGTGHDNFLLGIRVAFDICFTMKCMVEEERYHFFETVTCNSTMHRITKFDLKRSYCKYVDPRMIAVMLELVCRYNDDPTDENMLRILYSNPCGFVYTLRITTNYRQLKTIYIQRKAHKIPEWRELCAWIRDYLPYSELITGEMFTP